jgi:hypothetical protein
VECFVYNRTPAYDAIVERMKKHEKEDESTASSETLAKQKSNATTGTDEGEPGFGARLRKAAKSATAEKAHNRDSSSSAGSVYR